MSKPIPFHDVKLSPAAVREVNRVLKSGWLTTGSVTTRFENEIARLLGVGNAVAVNSATSGILLALRAVGAGPDTEVITTPFSFAAGVESIINLGARPVFVDIEPDSLNIDPQLIEKRITKKTRAILTVDLAGFPCDYPAICRIAARYKIPVISDSAHAVAATVHGKSIPQYADLTVLSFHATKNLTCGEGGMVVSRDAELIQKIRLWTKHGMTKSAYERKKSGTWSYDVTDRGFKANMSDVLAAIGLGELGTFQKNQKTRERLALRYIANFAHVDDLLRTPFLKAGFHHAWHLFIVRLNLKALTINRQQVIAELSKGGIGCSVHYRPIHTLAFAKKAGLSRQKFDHTECAGESVISLPLNPLLKPADIDRISESLIRILKRRAR
jgi:dTDP-4-amino-4,6-dideoxygalactose transaminase